MSKIRINGAGKLSGDITVNGSKNAALPLLAATLLTDKPITLKNIPRITDVENLLVILNAIGAKTSFSKNTALVTAKKLLPAKIPRDVVGKLRGSVLIMGALLGRTREAYLPEPGGDVIGARPIDVHLDAFKQLGATVNKKNRMVYINGKKFKAGRVILSEFSVTATENVMIVAATLPGTTTIEIAANEPHIVTLAQLLSKMGAKIEGAGTHVIKIKGKRKLGSATIVNSSDMLEAGLFILLAAATRSPLTVKNVPINDLHLFFKKLDDMGINRKMSGHTVKIIPSAIKSFSLQSMPHPGIATDLQAPFAVLATQAQGTSLIHDPMYENRFKHCEELIKMGANITVCDPHRVLIEGPTKLEGKQINSLDIRSGATLIMAGLVARKQTIINDPEIIDRGYENLVSRLKKVGADIERIE